MNYLLFRLLEGTSPEKAEAKLRKKGLEHPFHVEENGALFIGGHCHKDIEIEEALLVDKKKAVVDWHEQWSLFAHDFREGKAHIALGKNTLKLTPGPGFGDLSHPTTFLMLEALKRYAPGESIVDVGTGSGILALAALLVGAKKAIGLDIDLDALKHAKQNARLNKLKARFTTALPANFPKGNVFLMNIIFPEQMILKPQQFNSFAKLWIVSGILAKEKKKYMAQAKKWGWILEQTEQKGEWLCLVFHQILERDLLQKPGRAHKSRNAPHVARRRRA